MTKSVQEREVPLDYNLVFREYFIDLRSPEIKLIYYCPWCSEKMPCSLRDEFFDILEKEYGVDDNIFEISQNKQLPEEFKSDTWWKKRNL